MCANLRDPEWVARAVATGVPREAIEVFRMFAGIPADGRDN
jgi:hypothetical protein